MADELPTLNDRDEKLEEDSGCLICGGRIKHTHLGVNSCRACAMFYKRTTEVNKELVCRSDADDCWTKDQKTSCRKCRYARFKQVLAQAGAEPTAEKKAPETRKHFDHDSFFEIEPSTSKTPTLERLRMGYSLMCLVRKAAEMGFRARANEKDEIHRGDLVFIPATYGEYLKYGQTFGEAIRAYGNYAFDDFRQFDEATKDFMIDTTYSILQPLDASYRLVHHFPDDDDMRSPGYTSYIRVSGLDAFFSDCPDPIDVPATVIESRKFAAQTYSRDRRQYRRVRPDNVEFVALAGLALWNDEITNHSEQLMECSMRNRDAILSDLHAYYAKEKNMEEYAARMGDVYSLFVIYSNSAKQKQEDYEIFRLMNLFKAMIENCEKRLAPRTDDQKSE